MGFGTSWDFAQHAGLSIMGLCPCNPDAVYEEPKNYGGLQFDSASEQPQAKGVNPFLRVSSLVVYDNKEISDRLNAERTQRGWVELARGGQLDQPVLADGTSSRLETGALVNPHAPESVFNRRALLERVEQVAHQGQVSEAEWLALAVLLDEEDGVCVTVSLNVSTTMQ